MDGDADAFIRTGFFESIFSCSPLHLGVIITSLIIFNFPAITNSDKLLFYFQFTFQTLPFLYMLFEKPITSGYYITISSTVVVILYVVFSILHFKQHPSDCDDCDNDSDGNSHSFSVHNVRIKNHANKHGKDKLPLSITTRTRSLMMFRGGLYTACGILMISQEYQGFRMTFAKSDGFGTGLMDAGIGSFVILMGIFGPSRQWINYKHVYDKRKTFYRILISSIIIFFVGIVYNFMKNMLNIVSDRSDYGRNLNIFFVFSFIKFFGNSMELLTFNVIPFWVISTLIAIGHEIVYFNFKLKTTLLLPDLNDRVFDSFIFANRAGLTTMFGLLPLYFMGAHIGYIFYKTRSNCPGINKKANHNMAIILFGGSFCLGFLCRFIEIFKILEPPSRKLCNITYSCWVISFFLYNLGIALVLEVNEDKLYKLILPPKSFFETIDFCGIEYFTVINGMWMLVKVANRQQLTDNKLGVPLIFIICFLMSVLSIRIHNFIQPKIHFKVI